MAGMFSGVATFFSTWEEGVTKMAALIKIENFRKITIILLMNIILIL